MDQVSVTGLGRLKERLGKDTTVAPGQTVAQALEGLQLGTVGGLPLTPMVNGRVSTGDYVLKPGDRLVLVPTIGGGL
jgi:sulfur carrier protein ThiS